MRKRIPYEIPRVFLTGDFRELTNGGGNFLIDSPLPFPFPFPYLIS